MPLPLRCCCAVILAVVQDALFPSLVLYRAFVIGVLAAYLLLPPVAFLLFRKDWPPLACLVGVSGLSLALHGWFVLHGDTNLGAEIVRNGLPRCVAGFFAGVLVAMAWRADKGSRARLALAAATATFALWRAGLCPETLAIPLSFAALVYWLASTSAARGNPLASRFAVHLGDVSYSTYLGHFLLWIVFKHLFVEDPTDVPLPLIGLYLAGVYLSSVLLYRWVEAPGRQFLQSLGRKGTSPVTA